MSDSTSVFSSIVVLFLVAIVGIAIGRLMIYIMDKE
jgi:hypothetical protein